MGTKFEVNQVNSNLFLIISKCLFSSVSNIGLTQTNEISKVYR